MNRLLRFFEKRSHKYHYNSQGERVSVATLEADLPFDAANAAADFALQTEEPARSAVFVFQHEPTAPDFGYTCEDLDPATSLSYHRARCYDPSVGRWLSQDPLGPQETA
jgi:RHS repeat-associated protein